MQGLLDSMYAGMSHALDSCMHNDQDLLSRLDGAEGLDLCLVRTCERTLRPECQGVCVDSAKKCGREGGFTTCSPCYPLSAEVPAIKDTMMVEGEVYSGLYSHGCIQRAINAQGQVNPGADIVLYCAPGTEARGANLPLDCSNDGGKRAGGFEQMRSQTTSADADVDVSACPAQSSPEVRVFLRCCSQPPVRDQGGLGGSADGDGLCQTHETSHISSVAGPMLVQNGISYSSTSTIDTSVHDGVSKGMIDVDIGLMRSPPGQSEGRFVWCALPLMGKCLCCQVVRVCVVYTWQGTYYGHGLSQKAGKVSPLCFMQSLVVTVHWNLFRWMGLMLLSLFTIRG